MTATIDHPGADAVPATVASARGRGPKSVLDDIAARRRQDVQRELGPSTARELQRAAGSVPVRDAIGPFLRPGLHLIAEIKRRSPSAGSLAGADLDVADRARAYAAGGASAISVLVEPHWFGGSLDDLAAVRAATSIPVLAKEFVVDPRQLVQVRAAGADLVLLLAALHPAARLRRLVSAARDLGLEPLVEAHDERELLAALATDARIIGLNNRDLRTLTVDPERAERLRALVPDDRIVIAEFGVREPGLLRRWRSMGFDGALVGEELMRTGSDSSAVRARVTAMVEAGRPPSAAEDPAASDREPFVKICGITESGGLRAAIGAGADAIGLNFVPGTRRALEVDEAAALAAEARMLRRAAGGERSPVIVGIFADRPAAEIRDISERVGLEAVQLSGREHPAFLALIPLPVVKVLHLSDAPSGGDYHAEKVADAVVGNARGYLTQPNLCKLLLDTADATVPGGTGRRVPIDVARKVAQQVPVVLAGGLEPTTVAAALLDAPAIGVDVAGGVEPRPVAPGRPPKDPFRVALFVKRAKASRVDRPTADSRPQAVDRSLVEPDGRGRWGLEGQFGGR